MANSLSKLKGLDEFKGDFIDLNDELTKEKLLNFYKKDYFKACDYCHDYSQAKRHIPIAVQTDKTFRVE